jgi:hypothetical protein
MPQANQARNVFFSWQSDLPGETNRGFIEDALESAIAENAGSAPIELARLDRDPGAPNLGAAIFGKIASASVFVADISIVNRTTRPTPNPNVLVELGYALHALGEERIILLFNLAHGELSEVPFDLRQHWILSYHCDSRSDASAQRSLASNLESKLRAILAMRPRNDLDVRVFVQRGFASIGGEVVPIVSVDVQNHSNKTVYLSNVFFEQADGKFFYRERALNGPNAGHSVEAGDAYSLVFTEAEVRDWLAKHELICAVVRDKIERRWSSDPATFRRIVEQIRHRR